MFNVRKRTFALLLGAILTAGLLAGCGGDDLDPGQPPVEPGEGIPTPTGEVVEGTAMIEELELFLLESFPVQVQARIAGNLPDGCTEIDGISVDRDVDARTFDITVSTVRPADAVCTEALVPFEEVIPLDVQGLPAATYTVMAGDVVETFTLQTDNVLPDEPDVEEPPLPPADEEDEELLRDVATVEEVEIRLLESFPVQVQVVAVGYLPDGCTEIDGIDVDREVDAQTFEVTIGTVRPRDAMCTQALVPFEETIELDVLGLPAGTYSVDVNGIVETFTLEADNVAPEG
jgi:inhibitor of cysteine peptidase